MLFSWTPPATPRQVPKPYPNLRDKTRVSCIDRLKQIRGILAPDQKYTCSATGLVNTLERRNGLALVGVQGVGLDGTVAKLDVAVGLLLPGESVLHPVLVVTLGEVLTGVSTPRLLAVGGSQGGLGTV